MQWMTFWMENAGKATVLLAAASLGVVMLRGASASVRHFLWTVVFAALLGLPLAALALPKWTATLPAASRAGRTQVAARPAPSRPHPGRVLSSGQTAPPAAPKTSTPAVVLLAWFAGCLAMALRFLIGAVRTSRMVRRAVPAPYAQPLAAELGQSLGLRRPARTVEASAAPMPLTWGLLRPVVVLPDDASEWPEARLRSVLLHELVHIRRLDLVAQMVAQAAWCLYWFHPLAWVAWRQLRKERERACDDAVLVRGVAAHDYAGHLLESVRALAARRSPWVDAPAMAEASDLESRVRALLDRKRKRRPLSRRAAAVLAGTVAAVLVPLAAIHAQASVGTLAGSVSDPSGARVPQCRVIAKNLDGTNQEVAVTDEAGEYRFVGIPSGHYNLEFSARGFAAAKTPALLENGGAARVDARLELGTVTENVVIRGQRTAGSPTAHAATPTRIKVGGMVEPVKLIRQTRPVYPPELQQLGVEGTVVMSAIVAKDGTVLSPTVRNTVDPRLATAALDAVRQWIYQPATLNGEPVETVTTITLEFRLSQ
ncbi:MAG TPA: M56 family metallopeptidase [Bryobacteraceae bacterium]|nr:M56 family metallopeptidase [Bryobacteraceae bacterium]HUI58296.1 M56 family metallopeptidase [Bryobacteraceae bacterium]